MEIIAILKTLWSNRTAVYGILLALALLGAGAFIRHQGAVIAETEKELSEAIKTGKDLRSQLDGLKAEADLVILDIAYINKENADAAGEAKKREKELRNVKKGDDGPVAPVLRDSLDRLRGAKPGR